MCKDLKKLKHASSYTTQILLWISNGLCWSDLNITQHKIFQDIVIMLYISPWTGYAAESHDKQKTAEMPCELQ